MFETYRNLSWLFYRRLKKDETVEVLTTAASILFASAICIAVANQQYLLGSVLTLIAVIVLFGAGYVERFINWVRSHVCVEKNDD